jgi:hypothetical protein
LILLLIALFVRQRDEDEPPLPAKGTRRRKVANVIEQAEDEGLLSEEVRRVLISLLTSQGLKWLQDYLQEESSKAKAEAEEVARRATSSASERAHEVQERAAEGLHAAAGSVAGAYHSTTEAVQDRAHAIQERVVEPIKTKAASVGDTVASVRESVNEKVHDVASGLATATSKADAALEQGADLAKKGKLAAQEAKLRAEYETDAALETAQAEGEVALAQSRERGSSLLGRLRRR